MKLIHYNIADRIGSRIEDLIQTEHRQQTSAYLRRQVDHSMGGMGILVLVSSIKQNIKNHIYLLGK